MNDLTELFGDVIHAYTRAQAIEDGQLVDVTAAAREVGFRYPVAMTIGAWVDTVAWTTATEERKPAYTGQDERGRLHDVVWMAMLAARRSAATARVRFELVRIPAEGRGITPELVELVMVIGPGDTPAPVMTIMLPNED